MLYVVQFSWNLETDGILAVGTGYGDLLIIFPATKNSIHPSERNHEE